MRKERVELMKTKYEKQIKTSVKGTKLYGKDEIMPKGKRGNEHTEIKVVNSIIDDVIIKNNGDGVAILSDGSYSRPADGSAYAEDIMCATSTLANVLQEFKDFYLHNCINYAGGLYHDRALYTPDILFDFDGYKKQVSVITCSAPKFLATKGSYVTVSENKRVLSERISFALKVAEDNGVKTLIVNEWGSGFGIKVGMVAETFKKILANHRSFSQVIFVSRDYSSYNRYKAILL